MELTYLECPLFSRLQNTQNPLSYLLFTPILQGSVQFSCSVISDSATPWTALCQAFLSITNFWSLLKLMSIKLVMSSNHTRERGLEQILPSQHTEGINPPDTLILNF